jgi:hypothetical protein
VYGIGTGEVLSLDVVNAVGHDNRWLSVADFVHLGVGNELRRVVFEFEHGGPACFSVASRVSHRHVASTSGVEATHSGLVELLEVDVLESLGTRAVTLLSSSHTCTRL